MVSADDDAFGEIARQIEERSPGWLVVWGVYTRQFVAFPRFDAPRGTIVTARYADVLIGRLRKTERALRNWPGGEVLG
jgi:hypothetical protein